MASTSAKPSSSGERSASPAPKCVLEALVGDVVDRRATGTELAQARLVGVVADNLKPGIHECEAQGQADVAEPDDCDAAIHGRQVIRARLTDQPPGNGSERADESISKTRLPCWA